MGSVHNDLHSWAAKARGQGRSTIEIDLETADRATEKIVELSSRVMDLEQALRARTSEPAREAVAETDFQTFARLMKLPNIRREARRFFEYGPGAAFTVESPAPAPATADKLKVAAEALEPFAKYPLATRRDGSVAEDEHQLTGRHGPEGYQAITNGDFVRARQALATLNEEG